MGLFLLNGVIAGLIAGAAMGIISEAGFRAGIVKSTLFTIDGVFIGRILRLERYILIMYILGIAMHLVTSMVFGLLYSVIVVLTGIKAVTIPTVVVYTLLLWLAMLFVALPVTGRGMMGSKIDRMVWLEQLFLHVIFGVVFFEVLILL